MHTFFEDFLDFHTFDEVHPVDKNKLLASEDTWSNGKFCYEGETQVYNSFVPYQLDLKTKAPTESADNTKSKVMSQGADITCPFTTKDALTQSKTNTTAQKTEKPLASA